MMPAESPNLYDAVVIGGGPAGLTAALYLARARYRVLVLEKEQFGGQITITEAVVNYPGVSRISGSALTETIRKQAEAFGAEFLLTEATAIDLTEDIKTVRTARGAFRCFCVLLATGAHPRRVGFRGEAEYKGRGVAYCATCDGEFFTGKDVFVVGGGYAAAEESVFLTNFARHVTILMRTEDFTCAEAVSEPARRHERITIRPHTELEEVSGENGLTYARWRNLVSGETTEFRAQADETFGVFVFAGYEPATALVRGLIDLDEQGYIRTDAGMKTSADGIFAAGDVCIKPLRQVVTATGDGALAATQMEKHAAAMQRKTGLHPVQPVSRIASAHEADASAAEKGAQTPFSEDMRTQLADVFGRMAQPLLLRLHLDDRPMSAELERFVAALADMTDRLTTEVARRDAPADEAPCVQVCLADGTPTGLAFHGVPGGHEFTSFVLGLYNAAGPGQAVDAALREAIGGIKTPMALKVLVSLSCTMCPELVTAAQHIAALNPHVTADVYDLAHFPALKEKYRVMSVPCLVVNDTQAVFGRKNLAQLVGELGMMNSE